MDKFWSFLQERALHVSMANDAFTFGISWLGVILLVAAALLIRYLRRR